MTTTGPNAYNWRDHAGIREAFRSENVIVVPVLGWGDTVFVHADLHSARMRIEGVYPRCCWERPKRCESPADYIVYSFFGTPLIADFPACAWHRQAIHDETVSLFQQQP